MWYIRIRKQKKNMTGVIHALAHTHEENGKLK